MKYITFLLTVIVFWKMSFSQIFQDPADYPGTVYDNTFTIDKGDHMPAPPPQTIDYKHNSDTRRLEFDAKFSSSCWGNDDDDYHGYNKLGRIHHFSYPFGSRNDYKLHVGWMAEKGNENVLLIAAYFHEKDYSSNKYPWVYNKFTSVSVNEFHNFDMFLGREVIGVIVDKKDAIGIRKPDWFEGRHSSNMSRAFFLAAPPQLQEI